MTVPSQICRALKFISYRWAACERAHAGGNGAYQYSLLSPDAEALAAWTPRLVKAPSTLPEISDPNSDLQQGGASADIAIKRDLAARYGLTAQLISNTLFDAYGQRAASVIYTSSNQYRVIMEADPRFSRSPGSLLQSWVSTTGGTPVGASPPTISV
ncbi:MAG: efflux RND transporter permease subunit [Acetobacteraceae bacterium]